MITRILKRIIAEAVTIIRQETGWYQLRKDLRKGVLQWQK